MVGPRVSLKKGAFLGLRNHLVVVCAALVMVVLYLLPLPQPLASPQGLVQLTVAGKGSLAVLAFVIILWITEALPSVLALLGLLLAYAFRLAPFGEIVSRGFGNSIVVFLSASWPFPPG